MDKSQKKKIALAFGKNLKRKRLENNWSLRRFAAEADMEHKHIERIEKGEVCPNLSTIIQLAETLRISPAALLPE